MSKTQLDAFRRILESTQSELKNGRMNREAFASDASPDELDRIQEAGNHEYAVRNLERDSSRLREVRAALRRLGDETFGTCAGCEEPIVLKRLTAVPWAELCIVCQEDADRCAAAYGRDAKLDFMAA